MHLSFKARDGCISLLVGMPLQDLCVIIRITMQMPEVQLGSDWTSFHYKGTSSDHKSSWYLGYTYNFFFFVNILFYQSIYYHNSIPIYMKWIKHIQPCTICANYFWRVGVPNPNPTGWHKARMPNSLGVNSLSCYPNLTFIWKGSKAVYKIITVWKWTFSWLKKLPQHYT